jgi:peptidoglycan/xylan/chitin deacetylase (PgdA/CDA1 family)
VSRKKLFFNVACDCEATQKSVNDAALGERAVRGIVDVLHGEGLKGTFFVIARDLEVHASLYGEIHHAGHEVGVHLHPAELGYSEFCGVHGPDEQRAMLRESSVRFAQVMGFAPRAFCMGYGSANDHTYQALVDCGFTHGKCSIPTRVLPECAAVWAGASLDMHYAHRFNRLLCGDLDFVEIPSTLDPDSRVWGGKHPQDLRVELIDARHHWYTIDKAVRRQLRDNVAVSYIQAVTHNTFDFSDRKNFRRETLVGIIESVKSLAANNGLELSSVACSDLASLYRENFPLNAAAVPELTLDTRGRAVCRS